MGAACGRQRRLTPEEQEVLQIATDFRAKLLREVHARSTLITHHPSTGTDRASAGGAIDVKAENKVVLMRGGSAESIPSYLASSSEGGSSKGEGTRGSMGGTNEVAKGAKNLMKLIKSHTVGDLGSRAEDRGKTESRASTTSEDSEEQNRVTAMASRNTHSGLKPLRSLSHMSRGSIIGQQMVEADCGFTITVPGKVGCEDDKVQVGAGHSLKLLRTRKVHKNARRAKKAFAQRRLGNLEHEPQDEENADDILGAVEDSPVEALTEEERKGLIKVFQKHFLFASLDAKEHEMLLGQLVHQEKNKSDYVCRRGEKGDSCFVIRSGICAVQVDGKQVAELSAGHTFGELAMIYDVPRAATIVCASPKVSLCMIRGPVYRRAMARAREGSMNEMLAFLNSHDIFSKLTLEEKMMLVNVLALQTFEPGHSMIDENVSRSAEWMFLVQEGSVEVIDQYKNRTVLGAGATICGRGMPYGSKAVAAKALSHVKCLAIGQTVINRLFGNISEVLRQSTVRSFLQTLPFFGELTEKQQITVAGLFHDHHFHKGETIVTALADPQLVLVMEGEVSVVRDSPQPAPKQGRSDLKILNPDVHDEFDSIMPSTKVAPLQTCPAPPEVCAPELELPHSASFTRRNKQEVLRSISTGPETLRSLQRGEVFGGDTFREDGHMEHSLVARSECVVCRAGHEEVCRSLRGYAEKTPPLSWIITRNRIKKTIKSIFPFSALYEEMLDMVTEAFERVEYPPNTMIMRQDESTRFFSLVVEGEAVRRAPGESPEPLRPWAAFGTRQLLMGAPSTCEISAAGTGCVLVLLRYEQFMTAAGVLQSELQTKMQHQDMMLSLKDIVHIGTLGEGQFGIVRRVNVRGIFGEDFALKRISKKKVIELEQQSSIALEKGILAECCHPLIVRLICSFQDSHSLYLLMENIRGDDLFTAIREIGQLSEEHILFFSASVVLAIEYIHSRGIIYRDLKPENVMLEGQGFVKLVDFGCCTRKARSYTFVGTPEYIAPEMILGKGYGKAIDWWAVGVMAYEMICGPLPFGEGCTDPLETFREVLEKPLAIPNKVASEASDLLHALMERSPEQRLGSGTLTWMNEVRVHPYFEGLQWDAILEKSTLPPYVPKTPASAASGGPGSGTLARSGSMPEGSMSIAAALGANINLGRSGSLPMSQLLLGGGDDEDHSPMGGDRNLEMDLAASEGLNLQPDLTNNDSDDDVPEDPDPGADLAWCADF